MFSSLTGSSSSPLKKPPWFLGTIHVIWSDIRSELEGQSRGVTVGDQRVFGKSSGFSPEFVEVRAISSTPDASYQSGLWSQFGWHLQIHCLRKARSELIQSHHPRNGPSLIAGFVKHRDLESKETLLIFQGSNGSSISNSAFQDFPSVLPSWIVIRLASISSVPEKKWTKVPGPSTSKEVDNLLKSEKKGSACLRHGPGVFKIILVQSCITGSESKCFDFGWLQVHTGHFDWNGGRLWRITGDSYCIKSQFRSLPDGSLTVIGNPNLIQII